MADTITINGVSVMPKAEGLKITAEKVWSENTGRTADGTMVGDIIAIKPKLEIELPPMSRSEVASLDAAISSAFFSVTYSDPRTNSRVTGTFYANSPSYPVYSYVNGLPTYVGVKVNLIAQ